MRCCICQSEIEIEYPSRWAGGHNAQPVMDGRCCSQCNNQVVIPTRLRRIYKPKVAP